MSKRTLEQLEDLIVAEFKRLNERIDDLASELHEHEKTTDAWWGDLNKDIENRRKEFIDDDTELWEAVRPLQQDAEQRKLDTDYLEGKVDELEEALEEATTRHEEDEKDTANWLGRLQRQVDELGDKLNKSFFFIPGFFSLTGPWAHWWGRQSLAGPRLRQ